MSISWFCWIQSSPQPFWEWKYEEVELAILVHFKIMYIHPSNQLNWNNKKLASICSSLACGTEPADQPTQEWRILLSHVLPGEKTRRLAIFFLQRIRAQSPCLLSLNSYSSIVLQLRRISWQPKEAQNLHSQETINTNGGIPCNIIEGCHDGLDHLFRRSIPLPPTSQVAALSPPSQLPGVRSLLIRSAKMDERSRGASAGGGRRSAAARWAGDSHSEGFLSLQGFFFLPSNLHV